MRCTGIGSHPDFVVVEIDGVERRRYVCKTCGQWWPIELVRSMIALVPPHPDRRPGCFG